MSFVFYDVETTGLRKGFDQIVQFAAVLTDENLHEQDRFEIRCRLQPHVLPHPKALLSNRISIERLTDPSLASHYQMICAIRRKLAAWGKAVFVGYNSIRFDEEMLRHAFFQCLFPAYLTSMPGNGRADAMHAVLLACAEASPCLTLPVGPNGQRTFRLDAVAAANGIDLGQSHDAAIDVATTLELCRRIHLAAPEVWSRIVRTSNKAVVADLVQSEPVFVLSEFLGWETSHCLVCCLGLEPGNPNGRLCWDLSWDNGILDLASEDEIKALAIRRDGPIRRLRVNAAPAVSMPWDAPDDWGLGDTGLAETRAARLTSQTGVVSKIIAARAAMWGERSLSPHFEQRLYDGFPGSGDEILMADYHEEAKARRRILAERFEDERLRCFAGRLVHMEHRSALTETERRGADTDLATRLMSSDEGPLSLPQALECVDQEIAMGREDDIELLREYRGWLTLRFAKAEAFLADNIATPAY